MVVWNGFLSLAFSLSLVLEMFPAIQKPFLLSAMLEGNTTSFSLVPLLLSKEDEKNPDEVLMPLGPRLVDLPVFRP